MRLNHVISCVCVSNLTYFQFIIRKNSNQRFTSVWHGARQRAIKEILRKSIRFHHSIQPPFLECHLVFQQTHFSLFMLWHYFMGFFFVKKDLIKYKFCGEGSKFFFCQKGPNKIFAIVNRNHFMNFRPNLPFTDVDPFFFFTQLTL